MIDSSDHSSIRLFSIGVPVMATLKGTGKHLGPLVGLGLPVLDELGLVEEQPGPLDGGVLVVLDPEQAVGGDHHVDVGGQLLQGRPPAAPGLGDRDHVEVGGEPAALRRPVPDDAGRRHHQVGSVGETTLPGVAHQGQRLERLAEPHVVGEHAARAGARRGRPTS